MSKNKLLVTPAMQAEVRLELEAAKKDAEEAEEKHIEAQSILEAMHQVVQCHHELQLLPTGNGQIISCKKCHFFWGDSDEPS
ncbi:hypothetical protein VPHD260_0144 [Vibrio phage D260]